MSKFNNEYHALLKEKQEKEFILKNLRETIKEVKSDRTAWPLMIAIGKNIFKQVPIIKKKEVLTEMTRQRSVLENQIRGLDAQVKHKADEYEGGLLKVYRFLYMRFKELNVDPSEAKSFELPKLEEDDDVDA
jgi:chaperonin cofactor prefoldin